MRALEACASRVWCFHAGAMLRFADRLEASLQAPVTQTRPAVSLQDSTLDPVGDFASLLAAPETLIYGKSITDACLGWADSEMLLDALANG